MRKYFDVQPAEKVSASSLDIFKNLEKLVRFVCSLHQNNFCIRDICNSNVRWDKNGNLVILDLGSVCRIDDPDRAFNGKEDFLPLLKSGDALLKVVLLLSTRTPSTLALPEGHICSRTEAQ